MPIYDRQCNKCGFTALNLIERMSEDSPNMCPNPNCRVEDSFIRVLSAGSYRNFRLKGDGWFRPRPLGEMLGKDSLTD